MRMPTLIDRQPRLILLNQGDALLIIDLQNDFLPGGAVAVSQGDRVVSVMNRYIAQFQRKHLPIISTRDWHPADHCSFKAQGGSWPEHCVAGTRGAKFSAGLQLPESAIIVSKGTNNKALGYSGFEDTGLEAHLNRLNTRRLFIGGLATDYCVLNTALDALARHYRVYLLEDAIRAVDIEPGDGRNAVVTMTQQGAVPITLADLQ